MSAFNKARYNLSRYNVEASGNIWVQGASQVSFGFSFAGLTYYCRGNSRVSVSNEIAQVDRGRMTRGSASADFEATTDVIGYFNLAANYRSTYTAELNLSQIANASGNAAEYFEAELNLSQIVNANGSTDISLDTEQMNVSQIVWASADLGEVFTATADVLALSEYICEFPDLILRPGQTLVIDASTYNVLLDGQNAIHLQAGEWLDNLNRNTQSIVISGTGATRLTAEILYTERYL